MECRGPRYCSTDVDSLVEKYKGTLFELLGALTPNKVQPRIELLPPRKFGHGTRSCGFPASNQQSAPIFDQNSGQSCSAICGSLDNGRFRQPVSEAGIGSWGCIVQRPCRYRKGRDLRECVAPAVGEEPKTPLIIERA